MFEIGKLLTEFKTIDSIIVIVSIILFVVLIITFFVSKYFGNDYKRKLKNKSNSIRVFVLNLKDDRVNYFNASQLRGRKSSSITTFYSQFAASDREKLISWISDLINDVEDVKDYIEVSAFVKRRKRLMLTVIKVKKVDIEKQLIYLESHMLNYVPRVRKGETIKAFVSSENFIRAFRARNARGFSFCFNFYNKVTKADGIDQLAKLEIKSILSKFANEETSMFIYDYSKFMLTFFDISNKVDATAIAEKIRNKINAYLMIESLTDDIGFSVGSTESIYFYRDVNGMFKVLSALAINAKENNKFISFFDENSKELGDASSFKTEVENIINQEKLVYKYQPLFDIKHNRVFGYFSVVRPVDTMFKSLEELKNFSIRTNDDQMLFNTISRNAISHFLQEKPPYTLKLFVPISLNEIQFVNKMFNRITNVKEANIVEIIEEKDIVNMPDLEEAIDKITDLIRSLKSYGFEVALKLDDNILNLAPNIYSKFDYFILPTNEYLKDDLSNGVPLFKGLIESLLKYNKPMISVDIATWNVVELVYRLGINIQSGDAIGTANENVLPIDKKVITKIRKLKE